MDYVYQKKSENVKTFYFLQNNCNKMNFWFGKTESYNSEFWQTFGDQEFLKRFGGSQDCFRTEELGVILQVPYPISKASLAETVCHFIHT